jgi:hypothetical protein
MITNGDNFKPVSREVADQCLAQHFAMQALPIDAAGNISIYGEPKAWSTNGWTETARANIAEALKARTRARYGLTEEERVLYRRLTQNTRMNAAQALEFVKSKRVGA